MFTLHSDDLSYDNHLINLTSLWRYELISYTIMRCCALTKFPIPLHAWFFFHYSGQEIQKYITIFHNKTWQHAAYLDVTLIKITFYSNDCWRSTTIPVLVLYNSWLSRNICFFIIELYSIGGIKWTAFKGYDEWLTSFKYSLQGLRNDP